MLKIVAKARVAKVIKYNSTKGNMASERGTIEFEGEKYHFLKFRACSSRGVSFEDAKERVRRAGARVIRDETGKLVKEDLKFSN